MQKRKLNGRTKDYLLTKIIKYLKTNLNINVYLKGKKQALTNKYTNTDKNEYTSQVLIVEDWIIKRYKFISN